MRARVNWDIDLVLANLDIRLIPFDKDLLLMWPDMGGWSSEPRPGLRKISINIAHRDPPLRIALHEVAHLVAGDARLPGGTDETPDRARREIRADLAALAVARRVRLSGNEFPVSSVEAYVSDWIGAYSLEITDDDHEAAEKVARAILKAGRE